MGEEPNEGLINQLEVGKKVKLKLAGIGEVTGTVWANTGENRVQGGPPSEPESALVISGWLNGKFRIRIPVTEQNLVDYQVEIL